MRTWMKWTAGCLFLVVMPVAPAAETVAPTLSIESACEVDLNADKSPDIALVAETHKGFELIVLMRRGRGFSTFMVHEGKQRMSLTCRYGKTLQATRSDGGEGKKHKTNGAYLMLHKRGKPFVGYYWQRKTFREVWMLE